MTTWKIVTFSEKHKTSTAEKDGAQVSDSEQTRIEETIEADLAVMEDGELSFFEGNTTTVQNLVAGYAKGQWISFKRVKAPDKPALQAA